MKIFLNLFVVLCCSLSVAAQPKPNVLSQRVACDPEYPSCAEVSIEKMGYVTSDCNRITNDAQDMCAGHSIQKMGYVTSDCLRLNAGGRCAIASMDKMDYITSDCLRISNSRQDRCAKISIEKNGYVSSDCLNL